MNHRDVEAMTQGNQAAERYVALLNEYHVYDERLQKALAHKESFSEKVLARVTGDYRARMDQLAREASVLENQLRSELAALEKQLQAALPARQRVIEELEELELRHITGELAPNEYERRRVQIESQMPP